MKTTRFISIALLFVSVMGLCRASLGETEAQCIARYGPELVVQTDVGYRQVGDKAVTFRPKWTTCSLDIRVIFLRGLSCHESINNADAAHGLSEAQLKALLNFQGAPPLKWRKRGTEYHTFGAAESQTGETFEAQNWLRSDGATATFAMSGKPSSGELSGALELSTKLYTDAQHFYDKENGDN